MLPRVLLAIALLLPVAPFAHAQALPPAITVMAATRAGDDLTLDVRANRDVYNSTIRLSSNGVTAGLPQWEKASWKADERATWTFHLLKDLDSVTVTHTYFEGAGTPREQSEDIFVPRPGGVSTSGARLAIVGASLSGTTLRVDVANYGGVAAKGVLASLEDKDARKIGTPFSQLLPDIPAGASTRVSFTVPEDLRQVVVALSQNSTVERTSINIAPPTTGATAGEDSNVTLNTELPFREVDLGRSVDYAVAVKNGGRPSLIQLSVEGLASGYSWRFFVGGSAVPSLYLDRNQTRQVTLTITVPNSAAEVDRTLDFATVARVNETELARLPMGVAVRGVGKLEASVATGAVTVGPGGTADFQVTIRNTGSAPLFNVELDSRRPYGWTVRTEPSRVDRIDPGQSTAVSVRVRAPDVIGGGGYTVDVAARSGDTTSRYSSLAVEVDEPSSSSGWLWLVFLVLIAAVLGFAAWWRWRG